MLIAYYETVLLKLTNDLLWSMERENVTAMITLDLSAAFNTVDHKVLLTTKQIWYKRGGTQMV